MATTFEQFVAARLESLLRYAVALTCDQHLAQDVVQEALLRAQQRWKRISAMDNPPAYVKRMVTNEYLSWRRRRASRDIALSLSDLDQLSPHTSDPTRLVDERDAMLAAIARLPRKRRAAIVLRYYEGYRDEEIAAVLGCAIGTVRGQISRALDTLRAAGIAQPAMSPREYR